MGMMNGSDNNVIGRYKVCPNPVRREMRFYNNNWFKVEFRYAPTQ